MAHAILETLTRSGAATDTVMEVGGGPSLLGMMTLAAHRGRPFERVTFTDLATQNLAEVQSWLDGESGCFDYGQLLRWLEHHNGASARQIVDTLRCSSWELEETDWRLPVRPAWLRTYDVVASHFFVESVTRREDEFLELLAKVGRLARPGGCILLSLLWGSTGYPVDGIEFPAISLEPDAVPGLIEKAGVELLDLEMTTFAAEDSGQDPGYGGLIFVSGRLPEAPG